VEKPRRGQEYSFHFFLVSKQMSSDEEGNFGNFDDDDDNKATIMVFRLFNWKCY
jgi:hypothetical protein